MQIVDAELATVDQARAHQIEDVLVLRVSGMKPTACHVVTLEQSLLTVEPPAFLVRLSTDPRVRCTPDPAPFEEQCAFRVGPLRPQVIVHHAEGELEVDVEDLTAGIESATGERQLAPSIFDIEPEPHEAIGTSRGYDLGEAIQAAITQLPPQGAGIPDWLSTYTVVSIGAQIGGIAGFNHLTVRVSG